MSQVAAQPDVDSASAHGEGAAFVCKFIFATDLFLQKLTIPADPHLPVLTAILPAVTAYSLLCKTLIFDHFTLFLYFIFIFILSVDDLLSTSADVSLASLCLAAVGLLPLATRSNTSVDIQDSVLKFAGDLISVFAVFGILQMFLQGYVSNTYLFPVDFLLPKALLIQGYNNLNTLSFGSTFVKSNGIFLAEPSYLSQIVGLGIIIELSTRRRISRLAVLMLGLYSTFSGTGIVMIAAWSLYISIKKGAILKYLIVAPIISVLIIVIGPEVGLNVLLSRVTEFGDPNSSGFARFISMFYILDEVNFSNLKEAIFGRGTGTVFEYAWRFRFEIFDPTWGKLVYESGLVGTVAFLLFYLRAIPLTGTLIGLPITVLYFVLGGYLLDASIVGLLVSLVAWVHPRVLDLDHIKSEQRLGSVVDPFFSSTT